jgi:uncharacterized protein YndB with AHSA1/START domain
MAMQVRREIVLEAPVEDVWEALTDPEQLAEWFANEVELDVREGGEGRFRWADGETREASIDTVEPPRRLGFTWAEPGEDASRVELTLEEDGGGATRLTVVESAPEGAADWSWALSLRAAALPALR